MATSGIEKVVRLWEPWKEEVGEEMADTRVVSDLAKVCKDNKQRMGIAPFEVMLMRMGFLLELPEETTVRVEHQMGPHISNQGQAAGTQRERGEEGGEGREGSDQVDYRANCRQS